MEGMMTRTTIMLPETLKQQALLQAQARGISFGELIRQALTAALEKSEPRHVDDPLFTDSAVYHGEAPSDLAADHDRHLYEEGP
jgi:hypothetical protein